MNNTENQEKKFPKMALKETKHAIRTRAIITRGFLQLMQEKNFDNITILDICESSMITRATFYKYYEDKYHLVLCILDDFSDSLFKKAGRGDKNLRQVFCNALNIFLDILEQYKQEFQRFFQVGCNEKLKAMMQQKVNEIFEDVLKEGVNQFKLNIPIEIVSNFITGGFSRILLFVFENDKTYDRQEVAHWVNGLFDLFFSFR